MSIEHIENGERGDSVRGKLNETIDVANSVDEKVGDAKSHAKSYTDDELSSAKTDLEGQISSAESNAKSHADSEISSAKSTLEGQISDAEANAKSYTDDHADQTGGVHGIADGESIESVSGAQSKADSAEDSAKAYADGQIDEAIPARKGPDIWTPDPFRAALEARTGGRMTVVYSNAGAPSIFHAVPRMTYSDLGFDSELGSGNLTAFEVDGSERSEILVGAYQACMHDGEALALPGKEPAVSIDWDDSKAACEASGFHLMTVHEWAAIALWCKANGFEPGGNTDENRYHANPWQRGIATSQDSARQILTGTGPAEWRHDGTWDGISDLVGNVWAWLWGLKLVDGRIYAAPDNDTSLDEEDWEDTGVDVPDVSSSSFEGWLTDGTELTDRLLVSEAGIIPQGSVWTSDSDERFPFRGGHRGDGSDAGLAALSLLHSRSLTRSSIGFRAAFAP